MTINNVDINNAAIASNLKRLINQVYKLLPNREEGIDWISPLHTIIEEVGGMARLMPTKHELLFPLLCKLEGLFTLVKEEDFYEYRRTVFECLNLIKTLEDGILEE